MGAGASLTASRLGRRATDPYTLVRVTEAVSDVVGGRNGGCRSVGGSRAGDLTTIRVPRREGDERDSYSAGTERRGRTDRGGPGGSVVTTVKLSVRRVGDRFSGARRDRPMVRSPVAGDGRFRAEHSRFAAVPGICRPVRPITLGNWRKDQFL